MLKQIRGTLKKVAAMFIVVPLILAFAAWGVPEVRQLTQNHAIRVGAEGISGIEVQMEFDRFVTNRRLATEGGFDRESAIAAGVQNQIVQSLATRSALDQESRRIGLVMPREMVRDYLQTSEQFKNPRTGKFDNEALDGIMREYNYGVREFEDRLQSDLLRNQLMSAVNLGGTAPKAFVDSLVLRETENRTISYITITEDVTGVASVATPEALKEYYQENSAQFMAPEYRTFSTIILKNADFAEATAVSEAELRKTYDANKARYETPETRSIYQITYPDKAKADAAIVELKAGKPFETVATENGQALGDVTFSDVQKRDILDPKVGDAVFAVEKIGATAGPIEGVFGFTIAQVAAITPASLKPFDEVRAEIEEESQSQGSKKKLFEAIETIENARDTGASLADAAESAGATSAQYGPIDSYSFGPGGEIVGGISGELLKEAFKLEEGEESDAIEFADKSGYFFIAVSEVTPPAVMPYERVADEVASRWRAADRDRRIAETVKTVRNAVTGGKTLQQASEPLNRAPIIQTVNRRSADQILSAAVVDQVFSAQKGETLSGPAAIGDAQIIITVDEISYDIAKVSPDEIAVFSQYVGTQLGQELADVYASAVLADAGARINQNQIDALFSDGQ